MKDGEAPVATDMYDNVTPLQELLMARVNAERFNTYRGSGTQLDGYVQDDAAMEAVGYYSVLHRDTIGTVVDRTAYSEAESMLVPAIRRAASQRTAATRTAAVAMAQSFGFTPAEAEDLVAAVVDRSVVAR